MSRATITAAQARHARESILGEKPDGMARRMGVNVRTLFRWEAQGIPAGPTATLYDLLIRGVWTPDP